MAKMNVIATIIEKIEPHENADRLEIAFVRGTDWPIVVSKDSFLVGDIVIYFPVDCVCDKKLEEILLGGSKMKLSNGRIKAIKIRGYVSYGIVVPFSKIVSHYPKLSKCRLNQNVANIVGAKKYEPPVNNNIDKIAPDNSYFLTYTELPHLQQVSDMFDDDDAIVATEKMHGTSFRAGYLPKNLNIFERIKKWFLGKFDIPYEPYEFVYGSKEVQLQNAKYDKSVYKYVVDKYNLKEKIGLDYEIFGEIVGPGIQRGSWTYGYSGGHYGLYLYDIKYKGKYLNMHSFLAKCAELEFNHVPIINWGQWKYIKGLECNTGSSKFPTQKYREGCVYSLTREKITKRGRSKCKHLNPEFLLNSKNSDFH